MSNADASDVTRRGFLQFVGAGALTMLISDSQSDGAIIGPIERADFQNLVPDDKKLSANWIKSLFDRGVPRVYRGDQLKFIGMPVGGIGAGYLYIGGDGKLWHWDIFNIHSTTGEAHYAHPQVPTSTVDQGFELEITSDRKTQTRALDRTGFPDVSFLGEYPIATVDYQSADCPVTTRLRAFSPFIPLAADDSSLPGTVLRFTITNTSNNTIEGKLRGRLENAVLRSRPMAPARRHNRIVRGNGISYLHCSVEPSDPTTKPIANPDMVFEDWNKENYDGWSVEGAAFGTRPARRAEIPAYMGDLGGDSDRLVNSHITAPGNSIEAKDAATGKLTSKPFTITRNFIHFWIGGGNHPGLTCINVIIDGKIALSATGGNQNRMMLKSFDVTAMQDKQAAIAIVDAETGAWGNIGIGRITFSDQPATEGDLKSAPDFGTMALALLGAPAEEKSGDDAFAALDEKLVGSIGRQFKLAPAESIQIDFVLTWHFANLKLDGLPSHGRYYAVKYDSAGAVAQFIADNFDRLTSQTKAWHDTWYDSTLPHWFLDRTFLNICILSTSTCFRLADGRFYAWEGVGSCPGTCTHVWHYAHAVARLFPELERDTRQRVDLGVGYHPETGVIGFRAEFDHHLAVDGQAGTLLRMYREHQMSADNSFLQRNWPKIKKAFDPLLKLDSDEDGILEGPQMNTLDLPWYGKVAWLSSLYIAALKAGEQMAREMGDSQFADHCKLIADGGSSNLVTELFDGEYFSNKVDPTKLNDINSGTGCEIDQVFGQSWAFQVHLGRVLPELQTRSALGSIWKYNFTPDAGPYRKVYKPGRWYAMPGEAGLLMCTFPRAGWDYDNAHGTGHAEWAAGYLNECMNGFEHQVAGHMLWEGMVQQGLAIERAIDDRYSPERRNPWNEIECGDHYSRSMASHGVYLAACGYEHHGPAGYLAFAPRLTPENFKCAFTTAQGWGSYTQQIGTDGFKAQIALNWGSLRLRSLAFDMPAGVQPNAVKVLVNGKIVDAVVKMASARASIDFTADQTIEANQQFEIVLS